LSSKLIELQIIPKISIQSQNFKIFLNIFHTLVAKEKNFLLLPNLLPFRFKINFPDILEKLCPKNSTHLWNLQTFIDCSSFLHEDQVNNKVTL
jgi:hypothetical protein